VRFGDKRRAGLLFSPALFIAEKGSDRVFDPDLYFKEYYQIFNFIATFAASFKFLHATIGKNIFRY
jgi:hypothetical protein